MSLRKDELDWMDDVLEGSEDLSSQTDNWVDAVERLGTSRGQRNVQLRTGPKFFLQLLASFPDLQDHNIKKTQDMYTKFKNEQVIQRKLSNFFITTFEWNTIASADWESQVAIMKATKLRVYSRQYECSKKFCEPG